MTVKDLRAILLDSDWGFIFQCEHTETIHPMLMYYGMARILDTMPLMGLDPKRALPAKAVRTEGSWNGYFIPNASAHVIRRVAAMSGCDNYVTCSGGKGQIVHKKTEIPFDPANILVEPATTSHPRFDTHGYVALFHKRPRLPWKDDDDDDTPAGAAFLIAFINKQAKEKEEG